MKFVYATMAVIGSGVFSYATAFLLTGASERDVVPQDGLTEVARNSVLPPEASSIGSHREKVSALFKELEQGHVDTAGDREKAIRLLFADDPARTLAFIDGLEDRAFALELAKSIAFSPPEKETSRLARWVERQEPLSFRAEVLSSMMLSWAGRDFMAAFAAIDRLPDDADKSSLRKKAMKYVHKRDRFAALEIQPEEDRERYIADNGKALSRDVPEDTFSLLLSHPSSSGRNHALARFVQSWATQDPYRTVQALSAIDDPTERAMAYREAVYGWSSVDSYRASDWVATLPPGLNRDAAVSGLAGELSKEQPDMAFQWGASIMDPEIRLTVLQQVVEAWKATEPRNVLNAVANSSLSVSDREVLRAALTDPDK